MACLASLSEFLARLGAITMDEVARGSSLLAFQLNFQQFEGRLVAAPDDQTVVLGM